MQEKNKHPLDDLSTENFQVPAGEESIYHVVLEVKEFNHKTGERISAPRMQTFGANAFEKSFADLKRLGYDVRVVYDPTKFLEEQRQKAAQAEEDRIEEALRKQREEFEAKQAVDETLAERAAAKQAAKQEAGENKQEK